MATIRVELKPFLQSIFVVLSLEILIGIAVKQILMNSLLQLGLLRIAEIVFLLFICHRNGIVTPCMGISVDTMPRDVIWGMAWSIGFGMIVLFFALALFIFNINIMAMLEIRLPVENFNLALFFLVGGLIGPVAEELFFRGMVFGFFRRWGFWVAMVISTTAFAAAHGMNSSFPFIQIVGGALFAFSYEKTGNLMVPMTIHVLGNLAIFMSSVLA